MSSSAELRERIANGVSCGDPVVGDLVAELLRRLSADVIARSAEAASVVQRHPLGFLACRWSVGMGRTLRVHIWDRRFDWAQRPNWQIHDHTFSFKSQVLAGAVLNKIYAIRNGQGTRRWPIFHVAYQQSVSTLTRIEGDVNLRIESCELQTKGAVYGVQAGALHRSALRADRAITALIAQDRSDIVSVPRVVGNADEHQISYDRTTSQLTGLVDYLRDAVELLAHT